MIKLFSYVERCDPEGSAPKGVHFMTRLSLGFLIKSSHLSVTVDEMLT